MSITVEQYSNAIQSITSYPSLSMEQMVLAANKTLQTIADAYDNWTFLQTKNDSLNTTINSNEVDISSITDIAFINNFVLDDFDYRVYYQDKKILIENIKTNKDLTGTPTYYNNKYEKDKIIFDIACDKVYNISINYKRVIRTLAFTDDDYRVDLTTDTGVLLPEKFSNLFVYGLITNCLIPSNSVDYKVSFYVNMFAEELRNKIMNEQKESDVIMNIQPNEYLDNLKNYDSNI